jgi:hypothetical protein
VVLVVQEQILVQTLEQEVVSVELLLAAVPVVQQRQVVNQEVLVDLVVVEIQQGELNQEEMQQSIRVVVAEEMFIYLLQHKVVMVVQE